MHTVNAAQIQLGKLAEQHVQRGSTVALAVKLINDYTQLDTKLAKLAESEKLDLPVQLDSAHQILISGLSNLPDAQFDAAYINAVIQEQNQAIALLQEEDKREHAAAYQTYVNDTLPIVREQVTLSQAALVRLQSPEGYHQPANMPMP